MRGCEKPSSAAAMWRIEAPLVSCGSPPNKALAMTRIVATVESAARSRTSSSFQPAMTSLDARSNTGRSASTAEGTKLAATILRSARHKSPSAVSSRTGVSANGRPTDAAAAPAILSGDRPAMVIGASVWP